MTVDNAPAPETTHDLRDGAAVRHTPTGPGGAPRVTRCRYEPDPVSAAAVYPPPPAAAPITRPLPDGLEAWAVAARILRPVVEVLDRRRPVGQLTGLLTPSVARYVRAAVPTRGPVRLRSLRVFQPIAGAAEVTAVCRVGGRFRVIAMRIDHCPRTGWRVTALRLL